MAAPSLDFQIRRDNFRDCRFVEAPVELQPEQIQLRIDRLALTANNITYAALGDALGYWNFYPAADGWGRLPAWGFADVIASRNSSVKEGERYYGYFPVASHVVLQPGQHLSIPQEKRGFLDASPHRQAMNPLYNRYLNTRLDPDYDAAREAEIALFRPLFLTSFVLDDFLARNDGFGARTAILSSASSKTAFGLAALLKLRDNPQWQTVGLTSPGNRAFCEQLGVYDRVVTYDEIGTLPIAPAVYIDMAGDRAARTAVHERFEDALKYSCAVGATHWEQPPKTGAAGKKTPGPKPVVFFAPGEIEQRTTDWGLDGFQQRYSASWQRYLALDKPWLTIEATHGAPATEKIYRDLLDGRAAPQRGTLISLS